MMTDPILQQRELLEGSLLFWKNKLQNFSPLQLPTDFPRLPSPNSHQRILKFTLPQRLVIEVEAIVIKQDVTLFIAFMAVFKLLLYRYSSQEDICIGTPLECKTDELNGSFFNTVALRTLIKGDMSFTEFLQSVQTTFSEISEYGKIPLEKVAEIVVQEGHSATDLMIQHLFVWQQVPEPGLQPEAPPLVAPFHDSQISRFDLTFQLMETAFGIEGIIEYSTDLYREDTIERMAAHFQQLVQSIIRNPSQNIATLEILPAEERRLLNEFNTATIEFPRDKTIVDLFESHAENRSDVVAVVYEEKQLTYSQLNEKSNQLAHYLRSKGIKEESLVPICIERSLETMIGLMGIMKAGAAYVPIDPAFPQERILYVLEDTKAPLVVTNQSGSAKLRAIQGLDLVIVDNGTLDDEPVHNPVTPLLPHNLVYVIYTSGSTGKPKGVMIEHGKLLDHCYGMIENSNLRTCQSFALTFPLVFDAGHSILHSCLVVGGTLHVLSDATLMNGEKITAYLKEQQVDCMKIVPSLWLSYVDVQCIALPGKVLVFGGEPFTTTMHSLIAKANYSEEVYNHYGPTETTIGKCIYRVDLTRTYSNIPIGKPFGNTQLYIVDRNFQQVPIGIPGELCIGGEGVGRGYLNRAELTEEKFVANPFSQEKQARIYRTGDLARWLPDGNIECLGRSDEQVKIRGFRIELGEIESVLQQHESIRQAVVVAKADPEGIKRLAAYVICEGILDREALITYLKSRLPDYMVPAIWMQLETLPLTFNGKVNRKALPEVDLSAMQSKTYQAPGTPSEAALASIWQRLLGIKKIGIAEDFFALGGHSLLAMRVIAAVRKELLSELSIRDLFAYPTIAQLASKLSRQNQAVQPVLQAGARPELIPLSYNQQSLWFIHQLGGSVQYHIPLVLRIEGSLHEQALQLALQTIVNRHEVLRTVMVEVEGEAFQKILQPNLWQLQIIQEDNSLLHPDAVQQTVSQLIQAPFDLSRDHMLRASLIKLAQNESILVLTVHHIASDEWSASILKKELLELYQAYTLGNSALLATLPIQYADYALWQRAYLAEVLEEKLQYWKNKLQDLSPLQLPTDLPRPALQSTRGNVASFTIDPHLLSRIKYISQQQGVTLFMSLLTAFKILLYRYSGQEDICVGTPLAGRDRQETEDLIGFFVNTLPIRTFLPMETSFHEFLQAVRTTTLEAFEYGQVPFEKIVQTVVQERDVSRNPIFQHLFVLQNVPEASLQLADVQLTEQPYLHQTSKFDLTFQLTETISGIEGVVEYCTDLYKPETITRMIAHYKQLLQSIVASPSKKVNELRILAEEEQQLLLHTFNQTQIEYPTHQTIIDLIEQQVAKTPNAVAVVYEEKQLTYRELNEKANQLAHYLRNKGIEAETLVPICMERSLEMVIGIIGILKAGAAYVPIDPAFPKERIDYMLSDTKASLVIGSRDTHEKLLGVDEIILLDAAQAIIDRQPTEKLPVAIAPDHLSYVIYTSGSTGRPKGVMIEHHNVVNFLCSMSKDVAFTPESSILSVTTYSFDIFYLELFLPLIKGGRIILVSRETAMDGYVLAQQLSLYKPTHMQATPSGWQLLLNSGWENPEKVKMLVGGEAVSEELKTSLTAIGKVWNLYGPTETTIWSTVKKIEPGENVLIGKPIDNTTVYIIGKGGELNPIGIPGELCIGGEGVGRGYLNRPELTAEKFVANPFSANKQGRIYRTGDLARWLPDGNIECLGRSDEQVKIRGFRIELGEIESVLQQHESIRQAVVVAKADPEGIKRLAAYVICEGILDREALITYLKSRLPDYMVPAIWMQLETLPLTFNGKVNRKALPEVDLSAMQSKTYQAPGTPSEAALASIWQRLLGIKKIGIAEDFFALGGHSLLAMRVIAAVRKELLSELSIRDLFAYPTIAQLASKLSRQNQAVQPVLQAGARPELIPLSYNQQSLWFIHQLGGSVQYHIPLVLRIEGSLHEQALQLALQTIVNRHEVLRTVMVEVEGEAFQKILQPNLWQLEVLDFSESWESMNEQGLQQEIGRLIQIPFDLSKDYMLRASLLKLNPLQQVLVINLHHIASDGWSLSILTKELAALYEDYVHERSVSLAPLPIQYADYALWQRAYLAEVLEEKLQYWKNKLQDLSPLQLPTDVARTTVQSTRGNIIRFKIEPSVLEQLQLLGKQQEVTLFMNLLTAFKVLLYRYSGQEDICVGIPVAGRHNQQTEDLIGFFVNSLPLRTRLNGGMNFVQLLQAVRTTTLEAFEYGQVPFEKIVQTVVQERDVSRNPVFQHLFVLQNMPEANLQLSDAQLTKQEFSHHTSRFDLTFQLTETISDIEGVVEYCTDLYKPETITSMVAHYQQLLSSIVNNPTLSIDTLTLLTPEEETQLLKVFNHSQLKHPANQTFLDMFEAYAENMPDTIAVVFEDKQLTYRQLNEKANQLAHYLTNKGVVAETLVPICMERSPEMIIGLLGILKAGAAYVPIDPSYPQERINYVLEDTHASLVVCNGESKSLFAENASHLIDLNNDWIHIGKEISANLNSRPAPHHLAYVIYTSGSTGKPKGVMIEHWGLTASTLARQSYYQRIESVLLIPSFAFDSSVAVIFGAFSTGGKLILCRSESVKDPHQIKALLRQTEAILCVPSYYRFLLEEKLVSDSALTKVIVAGENLGESLVNMHFTLVPHIHLYNEYGPTECTVWASVARIERHSSKVTIGKPIENTSIYILGTNNQLNPIGIPGELCIGGEGVGRGYLNRLELTAEKFVANPFSANKQARMYRTGDLARWLPDGNIEYLGRIDDQVKIRGFRIELGEIESVLQGHQQIRQAAVVASADKAGNTRLVAFVVAENVFDREAAVSYLKLKLPEHMVPRLWVEMKSLPLNSNGKVNKKALPEVDSASMPARRYEAPRTTVEERLAGIWQQVLAVEQVGRNDDFFELGGNSLMAMQVYMEVKRSMGTILPLSAVFAYPKLIDFAIQLQTVSDYDIWDPLVTIQLKGSQTPIYFVHDAFGDIEYAYRLATFLGEQHPMYGLLGVGTNGKDTPLSSMAALTDFYIKRILSHQPEGPYHLVSFSLGGNLVHALACRLAEMGKKVGLVVIFDAYPINHSPFSYRRIALSYVLRSVANFFLAKDISFQDKYKVVVSEIPELIRFNLSRIKSRLGEEQKKHDPKQQKLMEPREKIYLGLKQATDNYKVQPFAGQVIFFRAKENTAKYLLNSDFGWKHYAKGGVHVYDLPGIHRSLLREKSTIELVAQILKSHFETFEDTRS